MAQSPEVLSIRRTVDPRDWLDPFDVPFDTSVLMPEASYRAILEEYAAKFSAARVGPRSTPWELGTRD
ncbi:MAG: hypothetical protein HYV09_27255 [Deltaproteobacteria bacterium]|nr:hypothetical protein [Deltaproteobacteria bacterium]